MELPVSGRRRFYLFARDHLSVLYLESEHPENLGDRDLCDARWDWARDGDVPLRARHDRA